jgi:chloride channel, nucleotide-sensitive, 1A
MQLEFSGDGGDDDESFDPIELTLVPTLGTDQEHAGEPSIDPLNAERTQALFSQISACSNLHPDPVQEGDDDDEEDDRIVFEGEALEGLPGAFWGGTDGGLPPPMPGSSGWITAENVHEYFDAEGNWTGRDEGTTAAELGEGAGHVRPREEAEQDGANGHDDDGEDTDAKRARTE